MPIRLAQVSLIPQDSYLPMRLHAGSKFRTFQATGYAPDGGAGRTIMEKTRKLQQRPRVI